MPASKKKTRLSKLGNFLKPTSSIKRLVLFAIVFAAIGGGYAAYRSFAATYPLIAHSCAQGPDHLFYGKIEPNQSYSIVFRERDYAFWDETPAYVAAKGKADSGGYYTTGVYVSGREIGTYYLYTLMSGVYSYRTSVLGLNCAK